MPAILSTSRTRQLSYIIIILMVVFVARLFYLQVIRHDYYSVLANSEQIRQWKLPAVRGEIYVMNGETPSKLVLNQTVYTVWADPQVIENPDEVMGVLNRVVGGNMRDNARQLLDKKDTRYQVMARKVTYKQAQLIKQEKLFGIGFERGEQRVYPEGPLASQALGFVNDEGEGQYGVEAGLNDELTGKDGLIKTVADVRDVPLTIGNENINIPAQNGKNIVLSIDRNIQMKTEQLLAEGMRRSGAPSGSALVMDPRDGQILAMANLPTYNPAKLSSVKDVALLNNNIISDPYEPGSVIKTFTVATGVDTGVITPSSTFNNTDRIQIDDQTIRNYTTGYTGERSMQYALDWSLNTGMVVVGQRLGGGELNRKSRDIIYDYFSKRFKFNSRSGVELANEVPGSVISPNQVQGNAVRYATMTFGQGMTANMLQVSSSFSALINGGVYYRPSIVAGEVNSSGNFERDNGSKDAKRVISNSTSSTVRNMIHKAHHATYIPYGEREGYYIGGKTGTSQIANTGGYTDDATIATYLGFGGEVGETPRYVVMVRLSGEDVVVGGGSDAKPIFNDISNWLIDYLKLSPKG